MEFMGHSAERQAPPGYRRAEVHRKGQYVPLAFRLEVFC